jgi:hypothetical protein
MTAYRKRRKMIDFVISGLVLIAVIFAIRKIINNKKSGSCCDGCAGCASRESCHDIGKFERGKARAQR